MALIERKRGRDKKEERLTEREGEQPERRDGGRDRLTVTEGERLERKREREGKRQIDIER